MYPAVVSAVSSIKNAAIIDAFFDALYLLQKTDRRLLCNRSKCQGIMFSRAFAKPDVYPLQVSGLSVKDHCFSNNLSMRVFLLSSGLFVPLSCPALPA
jgi:hypothetical protein